MTPMTYKGYAARIEYSDEDGCFVGHVAGISDIISFHGDSVEEIRTAFHEAVDHYLASCEAFKKAPNRPYSGKIMVRVQPEVHARAAMTAAASGKSLNAWVAEIVFRAAI